MGGFVKNSTLQGTNTSHLGRRKIIFGKGYFSSQEDILNRKKKTSDPGAPSTWIPKPKWHRTISIQRCGRACGCWFFQKKHSCTTKIAMEKNIHLMIFRVVVSKIFYFHPYLGKWSNLTNIFQKGWNHQLVDFLLGWYQSFLILFFFRFLAGGSKAHV